MHDIILLKLRLFLHDFKALHVPPAFSVALSVCTQQSPELTPSGREADVI
jgi:hypothetical protein